MEGYREVSATTLGGTVTRMPPGKVPMGFAIDARNVRFSGDVVAPRPGKRATLTSSDPASRVTGLGQFEAFTGEKINLFFTSSGALDREVSNGSETTKNIVPAGGLPNYSSTIPFAEMAAAYNRMYLVFSDLKKPGVGTTLPQQIYIPTDGDGFSLRMDEIGLEPRVTPPATVASTADAGHIAAGIRYVVVLAFTKTSYISGATIEAVAQVNVPTDGFTLRLTGVPTMAESNVTKRVIAVTPAGGSTGGPWFYILTDDEVDGILNKATVINNNIDTSIDLDFTEEYLAGLPDVTQDIFDVIKLGHETSIYYSKNLKRLCAWGREESTVDLSEVDNPETFHESDGFIQVGKGDTEKVVGVLDTLTETIIFKTLSGYVVGDTTNAPNLWSVPRRWTGSGPCGPRAYDTCTEFTAYVGKMGLYIYQGWQPAYHSFENHGTKDAYWSRINWDAQEQIWLKIDDERKEILIGVPIDNSPVPNKIMVIDYARGLAEKRWSFDDAWAHSCVMVQRDLPAPPDPNVIDPSLKLFQLLMPSSASDGVINIQDPTRQDDNGAGFDQYYQYAYMSLSTQKVNGVLALGGIDVTASGQGTLNGLVWPVRTGDLKSEPFPIAQGDRRSINLVGEVNTYHRNFDGRNASWFSISFSNNKQAGSYFELHSFSLWLRLAWANRV